MVRSLFDCSGRPCDDTGFVLDDAEPWVFGLAVAILVAVFMSLRVPDAGPATVPLRLGALAVAAGLGVLRYRMTDDPSWIAVWACVGIVLVTAAVVWVRCGEARRAAGKGPGASPGPP